MIFVSYEEHRVGWHVCDLHGKYSFSNDIVFNENSSGHLDVSQPLSSLDEPVTSSDPLHPPHDRPCLCTTMGQAYDEVLHLKEFCRSTCDRTCALASGGASGGAILSLLSVAISDGTVICHHPFLFLTHFTH